MTTGKILIVAVLAGALGLAFAIFSQRWPGQEEGPIPTHRFAGDSEPGRFDHLPQLQLPDIHGEEVDISGWTGEILVLNFWATWCPPCLRELPLFDELQRAHQDGSLQVVGIAIDGREEVDAFLKEHPVSFPILLGGMDAIEMSRRLGNRMQGLPFTAIFDRKGKLVYDQAGEMTRSSLSEQLDPLLSEVAGTQTTGN